MELMIGAGLALALLYFWLLGHWFARVVTFLAFGAGFVAELACIVLGFVAGWFVASLPTYYWRHQFRQMLQPY
jgi:hypothetical protein